MNYAFIEEFFSENLCPTLKEMQGLFPTLIIEMIGETFYMTAGSSSKHVHISFGSLNRKIVVSLSTPNDFRRRKIFSSSEEFLSKHDLLINFMFCRITKIPEIYSWNDADALDIASENLQKKRKKFFANG